MKITILAVGKVKEKFYRQAVEEFEKRLSKYCKLEIIEVADEKTPDHANRISNVNFIRTKESQIKEKEGKRLLKRIREGDFVCTLAIDGEQPDSVALAKKIEKLGIDGKSSIVFIIGGSLGIWDEILKISDYKLSFSNMTFPHQLMRVILLEQIYRSYRIIHKEPYHK